MRCKIVLDQPDGNKLSMIADSDFVGILKDYEKVLAGGEEGLDSLCSSLERYPHYLKAFECMLEREEDPERIRLIERILLECEFMSVFRMMEADDEAY